MPCAMAFQVAWVTAAARTARVTLRERGVDGANGAPQAGLTGALGALIPSGVPRPAVPAFTGPAQVRVAAPLGPVPAALIVWSLVRRTAGGTLDATSC